MGPISYTPPTASSPLLRDSPCMVAAQGSVYLLGGRDDSGAAIDHGIMMDKKQNKWESFSMGDVGRRHSAACAVEQGEGWGNSRIWIMGGEG